jgi:hypothetical protein
MKNLLIYINPNHKFNIEHKAMLEAQIDNALNYWRKEDLVLCTNFPYEYNGVKAIVGPDSLINKTYHVYPRGIINSEVNAIIYLLENKLLNELTWVHDFDAWQINPFDFAIIKNDLVMTTYGIYPPNKLASLEGTYDPRINFGSIFFKPASLDLFKLMLSRIEKDNLYAEDAATLMIDGDKNIRDRIQIINQAYNFGVRCHHDNFKISERPLKVVHFPPDNPQWRHKFRKIIGNNLNKIIDEKFAYLYQPGQEV